MGGEKAPKIRNAEKGRSEGKGGVYALRKWKKGGQVGCYLEGILKLNGRQKNGTQWERGTKKKRDVSDKRGKRSRTSQRQRNGREFRGTD